MFKMNINWKIFSAKLKRYSEMTLNPSSMLLLIMWEASCGGGTTKQTNAIDLKLSTIVYDVIRPSSPSPENIRSNVKN